MAAAAAAAHAGITIMEYLSKSNIFLLGTMNNYYFFMSLQWKVQSVKSSISIFTRHPCLPLSEKSEQNAPPPPPPPPPPLFVVVKSNPSSSFFLLRLAAAVSKRKKKEDGVRWLQSTLGRLLLPRSPQFSTTLPPSLLFRKCKMLLLHLPRARLKCWFFRSLKGKLTF